MQGFLHEQETEDALTILVPQLTHLKRILVVLVLLQSRTLAVELGCFTPLSLSVIAPVANDDLAAVTNYEECIVCAS